MTTTISMGTRPRGAVAITACGHQYKVWVMRADEICIVSATGRQISIPQHRWAIETNGRRFSPLNAKPEEMDAVDWICRSLASAVSGSQ
jgi:hypothetical protein